MRELIKTLPPLVIGLAAMIIFAAILTTIVVYIDVFVIVATVGVITYLAQLIGNAIKWRIEDDY